MKPGPIVLMILLFGLGAWLVWSPRLHAGLPATRPGGAISDLRIGPVRGVVEIVREDDGGHTYRLLFRDATATEVFGDDAFDARFGPGARYRLIRHAENPAFRLLNITTWTGLAWVAIGVAGQLAFFLRMAIQWLVSERQRRSVVPEVFWWLSLGGGVMLFTYFVWRQDIVGVLGQSTGVVIYGRNLRLIRKRRMREGDADAAVNAGP